MIKLQPAKISGITIGLVWIYQGIFPKLFHIAPLEEKLTATLGLSADLSYLFIKAAGIAEIAFGIVFLLFYQSRLLNYINIGAMIALLLGAGFQLPAILIEAFNPVTTNIPLAVLSLVILADQYHHQTARSSDSLQ